MSENTESRMLELLADLAVTGLTDEELHELDKLRLKHPKLANDLGFERAAAAFQLASIDEVEEIPAGLADRLAADADAFFKAKEEAENPTTTVIEYVKPKTTFVQWLGWAFAGAAALLLAANIWYSGIGPRETARIEPVEKPAPSILDKRNSLLASTDIVKVNWKGTDAVKDVAGEVVWSDAKQEGYMTLRGLPVNDKTKETYQLWIFDSNQRKETPVDGGVFDVSSEGEVIIPIDAKIKVSGPNTFAITVEKPGGVVVSKQEKVVALATV